jgi:hypothetical protein
MDETKLKKFLERWTKPDNEYAIAQWQAELDAIQLNM